MSRLDTIYHGDCLTVLRTLPAESVHCVVTSPPYWALRDYGVAEQIGLEATPAEFVERMVAVFRELRRVLRTDGTCWINLGDSYGAGKNLLGMPWRVALALQDDGWVLRSDIIWHKPNPMPESVTDRPTKAHEHLFLLTKSEHYCYDAWAIMEPATGGAHPRTPGRNSRVYVDRDVQHLRAAGLTPKSAEPGRGVKANRSYHAAVTELTTMRNKRDVWTVASEPYAEAHFATFPQRLIEPCILAGTPPMVCEHCGAPWRRQIERRGGTIGKSWHDHTNDLGKGQRVTDPAGKGLRVGDAPGYERIDHGYQPGCKCKRNKGRERAVVLDPFMGSGTTALVAKRYARHFLGIELNPQYIALAEKRLASIPASLWTEVGS